jgi:hypothetical protein
MKRNQWVLALVTVLLIGGTAGVLAKFKSIQRLGEPGVKTRPLEGSSNLEVVLPVHVLDYTSEQLPMAAIVTNVLPRDTSFGQRRYTAPDTNFFVQVTAVLMGADRTSLHKPQFCLTGAGWTITKTEVDTLPMERPLAYALPLIKLTVAGEFIKDGQPVEAHGVYVYWYVADGALSASPSGFERMWAIARHLITTGVLQRWAYISYFAVCAPGQEDETYERMKKLITASVPEFQLTPRAGGQAAQSQR